MPMLTGPPMLISVPLFGIGIDLFTMNPTVDSLVEYCEMIMRERWKMPWEICGVASSIVPASIPPTGAAYRPMSTTCPFITN